MKTKYNWYDFKLEYMTSPILDVAAWGRLRLGSDKAVRSGHFFQQTKYWRSEKTQYLKELQTKSQSEFFIQRQAILRRRLDKVFDLMDRKLDQASSLRDLQIALQMITSFQETNGQITLDQQNPATVGLLDALKKASHELGLPYLQVSTPQA